MQVRHSTTRDSLSTETSLSRRLAAIMASVVLALSIGITACDDLVTEQITIVIAGNPTADFSADNETGCAPLTVTFSDKSSGPHDQWLWKFGDGDTSSDTAPAHIYSTPGTYTVTLKITDNDTVPNASDIEEKKRFIVVGTSVAGFTMDTSIGCPGLTVKFTPSVSGVDSSFTWTFGDGATSASTMPTHIFNSVGDFEVKLKVKGSCGVDSVIDTVRIGGCPTFSLSADSTSGCRGLTATFTESTTDTVAHVKRTWDFGDGVIITDTTNVTSHTYTTAGLYTVRLTVENTDSVSFTDSLAGQIQIFDSLKADFTASTTFACQTPSGQFFVLFTDNSLGSITKRIWSFGDGKFDSANNLTPGHAYLTPGQYTVGLEVIGKCGVDSSVTVTKSNFITLAGALTANFGFVRDTASAFAVNFSDSSLGVPSIWKWDFGDSTSATGSNVQHIYPSVPDTFNVTLIVKNACSADSAVTSATVIVPLP